ncbi:MFS general substrate transporter-like protein, partial [Metarhizium majus ARSEF 297]
MVGPVVGGALAQRDWRWCFYINLPICALFLPVMVLSLRIKHLPVPWTVVLTQMDWAGNVMFVGATTSFLVSLTFGGTMYEWTSWRTMTPIVMGAVGLAGFHAYEYYIKAANPCVPPHVFSNRTSGAAFYMVFVSSMLLQWVFFFWPVYFLAIRGASLVQTGVDFLPFILLIPGSAVVGIILSKTGRYRPLHAVGFVLSTPGPGLNVLLDKDTHAGV